MWCDLRRHNPKPNPNANAKPSPTPDPLRCGMWGVIAIALFADDRGTGLASKGGFYGGGGTLLGNNLILIISINILVKRGGLLKHGIHTIHHPHIPQAYVLIEVGCL